MEDERLSVLHQDHSMLAGIRTLDLRKVFTSPPPIASGGGGFSPTFGRGKGKKQPKPEIVALDGLSLQILPGEIFGLLGPNGAGKSTTVGILTTRVRPTGGQAWIGEHDVWREQVVVKRLIGVVQQRPNLDFALTAREILLFHGAYFGIDAQQRSQKADALLDRFQLRDRADQMVRGFSGGMMQRLSIARAMMHDPQVLFLDEPSAGLDPQTKLLLWEIIREYNQSGKTILLTTHNMEEADALCQRLAIIDHGTQYRPGHSSRIEGARFPADTCCACDLAISRQTCCSDCRRCRGDGSARDMIATPPMSTPIAAARWFQR